MILKLSWTWYGEFLLEYNIPKSSKTKGEEKKKQHY